MKITSIKTHLMGIAGPGRHAPSRNWIFVEIQTDEGINGIGEATTEYHELAVVAMIEPHLAPLLIGQHHFCLDCGPAMESSRNRLPVVRSIHGYDCAGIGGRCRPAAV